ncbi:uncharacterized protein LOC119671679 [Teleopsis dalmanni]|uniref:uncharacterized protein LOC119671679 n=1 Tax=Teleopsis dalmanni TaxID=139649 RepID=UPI0018CD86F2|nr:uncharacterized protein LOC119671679 [Teleopsis dalmanni]
MENLISPKNDPSSDVDPISDAKLEVSEQKLEDTIDNLPLSDVETFTKIEDIGNASGVSACIAGNETTFEENDSIANREVLLLDNYNEARTDVVFVKECTPIENSKIIEIELLNLPKETQYNRNKGAIPKTTISMYKKNKKAKKSEKEFRTLFDKSRDHSSKDSSSDEAITIVATGKAKPDNSFEIEGVKLNPNKGNNEVEVLETATSYLMDSDLDETELVYFPGNLNAYDSQNVSNLDVEKVPPTLSSSVTIKSSYADVSDSSSTDDESYTLLSILFRNRLKTIEKQFESIDEYIGSADILETTRKSDLEFIFKKMKFDIQSLENYLFNPNLHITKPKIKTLQIQLRKILALNIGLRGKVYVKRNTITYALKQLDIAAKQPKTPSEDNNWTMTNMKNIHIFFRREEVCDKDISFCKMKTTLIEIHGNPNSLYLKNFSDSMIICGPVTGTIFLEDCIESILVVACKQIRVKDSEVCYLYSHVSNYIALENSRRIMIGVYENDYPRIDVDISNASLNMESNNNTNVDDFGWNTETFGQSTNWSMLEYNEAPTIKEMKMKILNNIKLKIKDLEDQF